MSWGAALLALIGSVLYAALLLYLLRCALRAGVWLYRLFRPASPAPKVIELEQGRDWRYVPDKGEPIFGPGAKSFVILFVAGLLIYPLIKMAFDEAFYGRVRALIDATLP